MLRKYESLINRTLKDASCILKEMFQDNIPDCAVKSSDGKDFPMLLYSISSFPKGWNDLVITEVIEEWNKVDEVTQKLCLTAIVNKTYDEVTNDR